MSNLVRRVLSWLGLLGAVICGLLVVAVWFAVVRIDRATDQVYQRVDHSFELTDARLASVQQTVGGATITVEELRGSLSNATGELVRENLDSLRQPEERIERLNSNLEQVASLVDASTEVVLHIQESLDLFESLGMPVSAAAVGPVLERIEMLRGEVAAARETVASMGERIQGGDSDAAAESWEQPLLRLAVRLLATLGEIDKRIVAVQERLGDTRERVSVFKQRVRTRVRVAGVVVTCLILWMAAGQVALWRVLASRSMGSA